MLSDSLVKIQSLQYQEFMELHYQIEGIMHSMSIEYESVFVKYLKDIVQYRNDDTGLETSIGHIVTFMWTHYGRSAPC